MVTVISSFFFIALVRLSAWLRYNHPGGQDIVGVDLGSSRVVAFIALCVFVFLVGYLAPAELGFGRVPMKAEEYKERLDKGVPYQLRSSDTDGTDQILLVKVTCTSEFKAIRVVGSTPPPEHFTLIDGNPVVISPPVCAK